jgi:uncharacterized protein (DUF983 family)
MMIVHTGLALACPSCATGRVARGLVLGDAFWFHLLAITLPFVIVVVIAYAVLRRVERRDAREYATDRYARGGDRR